MPRSSAVTPGIGPSTSPRRTGALLFGLMAVSLACRLLVFPINEHLYGDAVSRTEMAEQWARAPHVITSFGDGAAQYGPLHLYLVAAALELFDRNDASRVLSLVFGVLTTIPLFFLTRRYFGTIAARWACLALAVWGLHVGVSTTGGSEAVALFCMWCAFAGVARGLATRRLAAFAWAALAMNAAGALRYDAWMYVPLLAAVPVLQWRERTAGARAGLLFVLLCLPFPLFWMTGNALAHGDALYPLTYIDAFHSAWAEATPQGWPRAWLRLQGAVFWPTIALVTLTPGVAVLGAIGMAADWRARVDTRWLAAAAILPAVYYAVRTTVLFDFVPLGRFAVVQVSLLLPFVAPGLVWCVDRFGAGPARRIAVISASLAVAMPLALGVFTWQSSSVAARVMRPISPTSTNPRDLMAAAAFVRREIVDRGHTLALDADAGYLDIQLGFFARVTDSGTARLRWPDFAARVTAAPPDFVVVFDNGQLDHLPWVTQTERTLTLGTAVYYRLDVTRPSVRIFERFDGDRAAPPSPAPGP